jgi:hypothetical protein
MKVKFDPLAPTKKREVTEQDLEHIKRIIKKVDGKEVPEGYLEGMDTIEWIDETKIMVGTYGFLSDREWEFDMANDTYELITIS